MRQSIRDICKNSHITGVYVTHDQKEALSMADGVAVLNAGKLMQVGPPRQLYERPANRFVADFLGETNFVPAEVKGRDTLPDGRVAVVLETTAGTLHSTVFPDDLPMTGNVTLSVRPEAVRLAFNGQAESLPDLNRFHASRRHTVYLGEIAQYQLAVSNGTTNETTDTGVALRAYELNPALLDRDEDALTAHVDPEDVVILQD